MSSDLKYILDVIPAGNGIALDLGGGKGQLRQPIESIGYQYINIDIEQFENKEPSVVGSSQLLPFKGNIFDLVISKDSLEHFLEPWQAIIEVRRVLKPEGIFVIWVPFMHPVHGDDTYRYTPLGLKHLLQDFIILRFDSPLWVFTIIGQVIVELSKHLKLGFLERPVKSFCEKLDRSFTKNMKKPASFAAAYRLVVQKR